MIDTSSPTSDLHWQHSTMEEPCLNFKANDSTPVTISTLLRSLEDEQYEMKETAIVQRSFHETIRSIGRSRRSLHALQKRYPSLARSFRSQDQNEFLRDFEACQEHLPQIVERIVVSQSPEPTVHGDENILKELQPDHRNGLLGFLDKVRRDEAYLSTRLLGLSPRELSAWPFQGSPSSPDNAIFPKDVANFTDRRKHQFPPNDARTTSSPSQETSSVYQTVMHHIFDTSFDSERRLRQRIWSSACATLIMKGRGGGDEFLSNVLGSFATFGDWSLRTRLEAYLLEVLQDGSFLLESNSVPTMDFTQPIEIQNASRATASSEFFDVSIRKLFQILCTSSLVYGVPQAALDFAREVLSKLPSPKIRSRTKVLVASRWFLSTFLSRAILYPESGSMLLDHHVGEAPRRVILKGLVTRLQQQVVDVSSPWKSDFTVASDVTVHVENIMGIFESPDPGKGLNSGLVNLDRERETKFLQLHYDELIDLADFFIPKSPTSPTAESSALDYASAAPSLTGVSTITTDSTEIPSFTPSSLAPSLSGTSMTSLTMTSEDPHSETEASPNADDKEQGAPAGGPHSTTSDENMVRIMEAFRELKSLVDRRNNSSVQSECSHWLTLYIATHQKEICTLVHTYPGLEPEIIKPIEHKEYPQALYDNTQFIKAALLELFVPLKSPWGLPRNVDEHFQKDSATALRAAFEESMQNSQSSFDYQSAHFWWRATMVLEDLASGSDGPGRIMKALSIIEKECNIQSASCQESRFHLQHGLRHLQTRLSQLKRSLAKTEHNIFGLRTKMWYVTDVKHSSPYEDALRVSQALNSMTSNRGAAKPTGVTSWARQRLRSGFGYPRAEAQVLEAMTASREHGGPPKLADDQVELTSRWLTKNSIENFCRGEELIHRFCFEVKKCGNKIAGSSLIDTPILWSSKLFLHEKRYFDQQRAKGTNSAGGVASQISSIANGIPVLTSAGLTLQNSHLADFSRYTLAERSYSTCMSSKPSAKDHIIAAQILQPNFHNGIAHTSRSERSPATTRIATDSQNAALTQFVDNLRSSLKSLLLSDLGYSLWSRGSETDRWICSWVDDAPAKGLDVLPRSQSRSFNGDTGGAPLSDTLSDSTVTATSQKEHSIIPHESRLQTSSFSSKEQELVTTSPRSDSPLEMTIACPVRFPFPNMYTEILMRFSAAVNPCKKLDMLYELEILISQSFQQTQMFPSNRRPSFQVDGATDRNVLLARNLTVPRTKATSLEEVMANCSERRLGTLRSFAPNTIPKAHVRETFEEAVQSPSTFGVDEVVGVMLSLFQDTSTRPSTLFRDLQMIAAFIPPEILDHTPKGKAFWDASIAALAFKEIVCESLIKQANDITHFHLTNTKEDRQDQISRDASSLAGTSLADAAKLWIIVAKEGSPVAARELGLLYLTHPDVLPRVTSPLSKPRDVFKSAMHPQDRNNHDTKGLDPLTFAVVYHWMELAANGGDKDAKDFLKGVGDLSTGK